MIAAPMSTPPDIANADTPANASASAPASARATPFDFILALEALAASAAEQQAAASAGAATLEADLSGLEDEPQLDELDEDTEEGSLEFLAGLLNVAQRPATPADAGSQPESASSGTAVTAQNADAGKDPAGNTAGTAAGAMALAGVLAEQGAADEAGLAGVDASAAPARANELLAQAPRAAPATVTQTTIATHVRDPRWAEDFGTRITTLVRGGESQAALQLSPVDLGPVDVTVTVRDSQATIHFSAAQSETRALIEASLPKLREMLAAQGFSLLDASVSQGFTQRGRPELAGVPRPGIDSVADSEPVTLTRISGLLDLYA